MSVIDPMVLRVAVEFGFLESLPTMTPTDPPRYCATVSRKTRMQPCGRRLTEAVAQAGEHEGHRIEACWSCGYEWCLEEGEGK